LIVNSNADPRTPATVRCLIEIAGGSEGSTRVFAIRP